MKKLIFPLCLLLIQCADKAETFKPIKQTITESIYASGNIVSNNQYQVFATASGIVEKIFVSEGDSVKKGTVILTIVSDAQQINKENARLNAEYSSLQVNTGKLKEAKLMLKQAKSKKENDSLNYIRQKTLWSQNIGSKIELEQRELAFENAKTSYFSALEKYSEIKRQIELAAKQSKNNLEISQSIQGDYTVESLMDGIIYDLNIKKGEIVSPQVPLAIIGDSKNFTLEMQVDEYDINKIHLGQKVMLVLNSHNDQLFEAKLSKINPLMNVQSKTFMVEAEFIKAPDKLYPNTTFEANIIIQTKEDALLIPREYLSKDSTVQLKNGELVPVKTGLKDYKMIEILSGIDTEAELVKPE